MEQLGARRAHNPKVTGSSPVPATREKPVIRRGGDWLFAFLEPIELFCLIQIPIFQRSCPCFLFKQTTEILRVLKTQMKGYFTHRLVGV